VVGGSWQNSYIGQFEEEKYGFGQLMWDVQKG
jgi:hypothetical protein